MGGEQLSGYTLKCNFRFWQVQLSQSMRQQSHPPEVSTTMTKFDTQQWRTSNQQGIPISTSKTRERDKFRHWVRNNTAMVLTLVRWVASNLIPQGFRNNIFQKFVAWTKHATCPTNYTALHLIIQHYWANNILKNLLSLSLSLSLSPILITLLQMFILPSALCAKIIRSSILNRK